MSFRIIGTGRCVPEYVLTNEEISTMVETSDEWISTRTGIKERRICTKETITDLAVTAAKNALEDAKAAPEELDMIICGTIRGGVYQSIRGLRDTEKAGRQMSGL